MRVASAVLLTGGFFLGAVATEDCPDDTIYNYDACPAASSDLITHDTCPYAAPSVTKHKRSLVPSSKFLLARNDVTCDEPTVYECPNKVCTATESHAKGETAEVMACGGKTCGSKSKEGTVVATIGACQDGADCITVVVEPPEDRTIDGAGVQLEIKTTSLTSSNPSGFRFGKYCTPSSGKSYTCVVPVKYITKDKLCPTEKAFYVSVHYKTKSGGWYSPSETCWPADISKYDNVTPIGGGGGGGNNGGWSNWRRSFGFGNFVFGARHVYGKGVSGWDNDYKDYSKYKKDVVATQFKVEYDCEETCTDHCCCADPTCGPETAYAATPYPEDWACDVAANLPEGYPYCYQWLRHVDGCTFGDWGWQLEIPVPKADATYSFDLFPAATDQHQRNGVVAGTVEVAVSSGGGVTAVGYKAANGYRLVDAHAYAGCKSISGPTAGKCRTPGVYDKVTGQGVAGASAGELCASGGHSWSWSPNVMCTASGRVYVVFHATVQKDKATCSCPVKKI